MSTIESEITSMYDLAQSEGMIPVMMTITPGATIGASATLEAERESVNTWIEQTFPRVLDIASIIRTRTPPPVSAKTRPISATGFTTPRPQTV